MIDTLLSDPEKLTLIGALALLIAMFIRGDVMPGKTHDKIVAHLKDGYEKRIEGLEKSGGIWQQVAYRALNLSEVSTSSLELVTKKTIIERSGSEG